MKTYGLIGYPLEHSFSRGYFSEKFKNENIDAQYLNFSIPTIDECVNIWNENDSIVGLNVTIPYKETIIPFLDELSEEAAEIGAVNVIKVIKKDGKKIIRGYNSDVIGFRESLKPLLKPYHTNALILGSGGASKAVAYALMKLNISYKIVSRTPKGDNQISYNDITSEMFETHKVIVNTSPLGMFPNVDKAPSLPYSEVTDKHLFFDLVYNPEETLFLKKGKEKGATIKNGLDMLHLQAKGAWEIWNK